MTFLTTFPLSRYVTPVGSTRVVLHNPKKGKKYSIDFVVVRKPFSLLIGGRAAQQTKLINVYSKNIVASSSTRPSHHEVHQLTSAETTVQDYADYFEREMWTLPGTAHLETEVNASPVIIPTRRVPAALKEKLKEEVVAPVMELTPWVSSPAIATKKSGARRICIDPRHLNAVLERETYQLPI